MSKMLRRKKLREENRILGILIFLFSSLNLATFIFGMFIPIVKVGTGVPVHILMCELVPFLILLIILTVMINRYEENKDKIAELLKR